MNDEHPLYGVYYDSGNVVSDWAQELFAFVEESAFVEYRRLLPLMKVVRAAEGRKMPIYAAYDAIEQHNVRMGTNFTFEEISSGDWMEALFSPEGDNVVLTDDLDSLLDGPYDDLLTAVAHCTAEWVLLWDVNSAEFIVLKGPHIGYREPANQQLYEAKGMTRGGSPTYVLPPQVEASIKQVEDSPDYEG